MATLAQAARSNPFHLTEEQLALQAMIREFADKEVAPIAAEVDEHERFPEETFKKLAELHLMGMTVPEQYGGAGAGYLE